jgi:hypothetical protein
MIIVLLLNETVQTIRLMFPLLLRLLQGHSREHNQGLSLELVHSQGQDHNQEQVHSLALVLILMPLMKEAENLKDQKAQHLEEKRQEVVPLLLLNLRV